MTPTADAAAAIREAIALRQGRALFEAPAPREGGRTSFEAPDDNPPAARGSKAPRPRRCSTGKAAFPSEKAAKARLAQIQANPGRVSMYYPTGVTPQCHKCGQYHLTSRENKEYQAGKSRRKPKIK